MVFPGWNRQVLDLPLYALLKRFIDLEDTQCKLSLLPLNPKLGALAFNFRPIRSIYIPTAFKCSLIHPLLLDTRCSSGDSWI